MMQKASLDFGVTQMLFLEKHFKQITCYKCYSGPISELDLGHLDTTHISGIFPILQPIDDKFEVNEYSGFEAAILLGRNDKPHKQWLEEIQSQVDCKAMNNKKIVSTLLSFQHNKHFPNIEQTGLLLIGNIEDIVQALPTGSLSVDLEYVSRTFRVKATSQL